MMVATLVVALLLGAGPGARAQDEDPPTCAACEKCDTCGQCEDPGSVCSPGGVCANECKACEPCYQYGPGAPGCDSCADCLPCDGCQYCDACSKCDQCDLCIPGAGAAGIDTAGKDESTTTLEVFMVLIAFLGVAMLALGNSTIRNSLRNKLFGGGYTAVADGDAAEAVAVVSTHDPPSPRNPAARSNTSMEML